MKKSPDLKFAMILEDIMMDGTQLETRNSIVKRKRNLMVTFNSTPLISIRRTAWKNALREMEWFLSGSSNINDLHESVRKWWEPWADNDGYIWNNYSKQFRESIGFDETIGMIGSDQIQYMIDTLKNHPNSRRNVITTWNTAEMISDITPITNCHGSLIMLAVEPDNKVHMTMVQRSADMVLGVPHNWIQYWALLHWLCFRSGRDIGSFTWVGHDCHIYKDHYDMTNLIIDKVLDHEYDNETPQLVYNPTGEEFKADDFTLSKKYEPIFKTNLKMVV